MKAILMAAGVGSRFGQNCPFPKCTVSLGDLPLIEHTVRLLTQNDIDVSIVVGYKKEIVQNALKEYPVTYFYNPFYKVTNSMASLWFAQSFMTKNQDIILANADVYWEQSTVDRLKADEHPIMMFGDRSRVKEGDYFFRTTKDGMVAQYGKDLALNERSCEYVGIARIAGNFVEQFTDLLNQCVEDGIYNMWWENVLYVNSIEHPIFVQDNILSSSKIWKGSSGQRSTILKITRGC